MMTKNGVDLVDTDTWKAWQEKYVRFYSKYGGNDVKKYTLLVPNGNDMEFYIDKEDMYWDINPVNIYIPFYFEGGRVIYNKELWHLTAG